MTVHGKQPLHNAYERLKTGSWGKHTEAYSLDFIVVIQSWCRHLARKGLLPLGTKLDYIDTNARIKKRTQIVCVNFKEKIWKLFL